MLKYAPIVLLNKATAALDPENEADIQRAIQELVREKTVLVVAHKPQIIRHADKVIVLKEGRVFETGTHQELLDEQGLYAQYWQNSVLHRRLFGA